jgi:hypothetical protein
LIGSENSLFLSENSLLARVGNLSYKQLKMHGKFGAEIAPKARFCENSLLNSLQPGNFGHGRCRMPV